MDDRSIVNLYWARNEQAISETAAKYGHYCHSIALNVLGDEGAAEECVNDTYLAAWNSMPDARPNILSAFLGAITRRLAINQWKHKRTIRRGSGQLQLALDELSECISTGENMDERIEFEELTQAIQNFVTDLPMTEMVVFIRRYWFMDPIKDICHRFGFSQSKVKTMLARTRNKLALYLKRRGFI